MPSFIDLSQCINASTASGNQGSDQNERAAPFISPFSMHSKSHAVVGCIAFLFTKLS